MVWGCRSGVVGTQGCPFELQLGRAVCLQCGGGAHGCTPATRRRGHPPTRLVLRLVHRMSGCQSWWGVDGVSVGWGGWVHRGWMGCPKPLEGQSSISRFQRLRHAIPHPHHLHTALRQHPHPLHHRLMVSIHPPAQVAVPQAQPAGPPRALTQPSQKPERRHDERRRRRGAALALWACGRHPGWLPAAPGHGHVRSRHAPPIYSIPGSGHFHLYFDATRRFASLLVVHPSMPLISPHPPITESTPGAV